MGQQSSKKRGGVAVAEIARKSARQSARQSTRDNILLSGKQAQKRSSHGDTSAFEHHLKEAQSVRPDLTKEQYCRLITHCQHGLTGTPFGNPHYAQSVFHLLAGAKASKLSIACLLDNLHLFSTPTTQEDEALRAGILFDWMDEDKDGKLSGEDLRRGLSYTIALLRKGLSYWIFRTSKASISLHEASNALSHLQRAVPNKFYVRFMSQVLGNSPSITRAEWINKATHEDTRAQIAPFLVARFGTVFLSLSTPESVLSCAFVVPVYLSSSETTTLNKSAKSATGKTGTA